MKIRQIGQKIATFGKTLGSKIEHGVRTLGQKVYDNRYKLLAGAGALASATALGYAANKMGASSTSNVPSNPSLSQTLRAQGAFKLPNKPRVIQSSFTNEFDNMNMDQIEARNRLIRDGRI